MKKYIWLLFLKINLNIYQLQFIAFNVTKTGGIIWVDNISSLNDDVSRLCDSHKITNSRKTGNTIVWYTVVKWEWHLIS